VLVEVVGASTTFVNPACLAEDTGTSTLVDGFDAEDAAAAGTREMGPTTATTVAPMLAATARFRVNFLTHTLLSKRRRPPKPDRLKTIPFGRPAGFGQEDSRTTRY
jgi:hypothetical protein